MKSEVLLACLFATSCLCRFTLLSTGRIVQCASIAVSYFSHGSIAAQSSQSLRYERISLYSPQDYERAYYLLLHYLRYPQDALSLRALHAYMVHGFDQGLEEEHAELQNVDEEQLITDGVDRLELDDPQANDIKDALLWKGRSLAAKQLGYEQPPYGPSYDGRYASSVAALLMSVAPNIQNLTIHLCTGGPDEGARHLLLWNNYEEVPSPFLQNLKHVRFTATYDGHRDNWYEYYTDFDLDVVVRVFYRLPRLESISVAAVSFKQYQNGLPSDSSDVRKLYLDHCNMNHHSIAAYIRFPRALEELRVSTGGRMSLVRLPVVYPKYVGMALYYQRSTVRVIDLDLDFVHSTRFGSAGVTAGELDDEEDARAREDAELNPPLALDEWHHTSHPEDKRLFGNTIGSLADFDTLKSLAIGVKFLLGTRTPAPFRLVDALPPGLESLRLRGYRRGENEEYDVQIDELLELKDERLPRLTTVVGVEEEIPSSVNTEHGDSWDRFNRSRVREERQKYPGREVTGHFEEPLEDGDWVKDGDWLEEL